MKTTVLCILDGLGLNPNQNHNSVTAAKKPTLESLFANCPWTTLTTHGERVGLPAGQMGNSEVGHLNIGAGRVVEQWLLRISRALAGKFLQNSAEWRTFVSNAAAAPVIHVAGLYSFGGVHSHAEHLHLLLARLTAELKQPIHLHLITDGRDTPPQIAASDLEAFQQLLKSYPSVQIASLGGRFFAMDRDKRWERVQKAYDAMVLAKEITQVSPAVYAKESYAKGTTDEFIEPISFSPRGICSEDAIIFFNFREDRMREIVSALCASEFSGFARERAPLAAARVLGFTDYDHTLHLPALFAQDEIKNHLGELISKMGLAQLRVAETEKYPHVTYFLNGGNEVPFPGEERKMVPSPRDVKTYDQKPEMSAEGVTEVVLDGIRSGKYALIVVNFANCDMVGHTGVLSAAIKAVETVDLCLGRILSALKEKGGQAVILADHGNAEQMIDYETGAPMTSHTTFPVPCFVWGNSKVKSLRPGGALCDVAPTVLKLMEITQPEQMSGESLF